jgi:superoxide dismutase
MKKPKKILSIPVYFFQKTKTTHSREKRKEKKKLALPKPLRSRISRMRANAACHLLHEEIIKILPRAMRAGNRHR